MMNTEYTRTRFIAISGQGWQRIFDQVKPNFALPPTTKIPHLEFLEDAFSSSVVTRHLIALLLSLRNGVVVQ